MPFIQQDTFHQTPQIGFVVKQNNISQSKSTATHGPETGVSQTMQTYPDLHVRRTLDQYYYTTLKDTEERDKDQVIYRELRRRKAEEPKIIVVDQLWLWILNKGTTKF
jgi:hypothetical protein